MRKVQLCQDGKVRYGLICPLYPPTPTALNPPVNENGTITPSDTGSGSSGALVSWGFTWEEGSRDVPQASHM